MYKVKECNEIVGFIKKLKCQKGIGIVCFGDIKNLVFCGGGCIFGLCFCKYNIILNKKVKLLACKLVFFFKVSVGKIFVIEDFFFEVLKIKVFVDIFIVLKVVD